MERRDFIKKAGGIGLGAGVLAAPAAIATRVRNSETLEKGQNFIQEKAQEAAQESLEKVRGRLKEAEDKIDQLQTSQKKTIKAAVIVTGLVIGLDLSLLI